MKPYIYVFVRKDIPLVDQVVQVGHICSEAGREFEYEDHSNLILLQVENLEELEKTMVYLNLCGIDHRWFNEPDDNLGYTSIATEPLFGKDRDFLKNYKLWTP